MSSSNDRWRCLLKIVIIVGVKTVNGVNGDSSAEYLQKAMIDLQQFNVPASYAVKQSHRYNNPFVATGQQQQEQEEEEEGQRRQVQRRIGPQDNLFASLPDGERIVLSPEDLAKMYRNALVSGTALTASSLRDVLSSASGPRFKGNHVEFVLGQGEEYRQRKPPYHYYFFPLETFANGFSREHLPKSILQQHRQPSTNGDVQSGSEQSVRKELANPLFLAISSFVGMALLFMTGVLFLPKLGKLAGYEGRLLQDDFLRLTNAVLSASEQHASKPGIASRRGWNGYPRGSEKTRTAYWSKRARGIRSRRDTGLVNYQG